MRVIHLSRLDRGGGISAAYRLHCALRRLGVDSLMFVAERRSEDRTVLTFNAPRDPISRVRRRLRVLRVGWEFGRYRRSRPPGYEAFSDDRTPYGSDSLVQLPAADVVNVHSMFHFVDFGAFFRTIPKRVPVVRTLHDMSFFTGGCHLDAGCGKYANGCGQCPQLGSRDGRDLSRRIWERKQSALEAVSQDRLYLVSPSRWLAEAVKHSPLVGRFHLSVIPHGVDTEIFAPRDRRFARKVLGIPQDAQVVIFVAEPISRPIKRFSLLTRALQQISGRPELLLVTAGTGSAGLAVSVPHMHLGEIRNERLLSLVYSAADLAAVPSHQENFPLTVLEALACGVPVVGSAVGGIREIVRDGVTGVLVPPDDALALASAIGDLLVDPARRARMGAAGRELVLEEYSLDLQARRYAELYARIVQQRDTGQVPAVSAAG